MDILELMSKDGNLIIIVDHPDSLPLWINKITSNSLVVKGIYAACITNPHGNTVTKRAAQPSWFPIIRVAKDKRDGYFNGEGKQIFRDSFFVKLPWNLCTHPNGVPIDNKQRPVELYMYLLSAFCRRGK